MQCLIDFIGIQADNQPTPPSGLYLNDLPGINLASITAITDAERTAWAETWLSIQRRAARVFAATLTNTLSATYRLHRVIQALEMDSTIDATHTTAPQAQYRGLYIQLPIVTSPFQQWYIAGIDLYLPDAHTLTIKIYHVRGTTLHEIDSIAITHPSGMYHIVMDKSYHVDGDIFIAYDATAITTASSLVRNRISEPYRHCTLYGATYSADTFAKGQDTFGLSTTFSLQCSWQALVCAMRQQFAVAFWYLLGSELMAERIYTDRINRYTTIDLAKAKALREEFRNEFAEELNAVVESLNLSTDPCVDCNATIRSIESHP